MPFPTYHWIEKILGYMKMACLCSIILLTIVLTVHATSKEPTTAFSVNNSPTGVLRQRIFFSMDPEMDSQIGGTLLPIWIWMSLIIFCWIEIEVVAVDKIDNAKHKYLLREAKRTQVRCLLDYTLACFLMGLDISCQDTSIADPVSNSAQWRDGSSFTAAIRGHFRFWPYPLGALAILSFISAANSALYISSRILYSLALVESRWPRGSLTQPLQNHLRKTTTSGVPVYALIVTLLFGGLDYQLMKTFAVQVDYHVCGVSYTS
jgi:amino acid permease